jgi:hypothetical protein
MNDGDVAHAGDPHFVIAFEVVQGAAHLRHREAKAIGNIVLRQKRDERVPAAVKHVLLHLDEERPDLLQSRRLFQNERPDFRAEDCFDALPATARPGRPPARRRSHRRARTRDAAAAGSKPRRAAAVALIVRQVIARSPGGPGGRLLLALGKSARWAVAEPFVVSGAG